MLRFRTRKVRYIKSFELGLQKNPLLQHARSKEGAVFKLLIPAPASTLVLATRFFRPRLLQTEGRFKALHQFASTEASDSPGLFTQYQSLALWIFQRVADCDPTGCVGVTQ